MKRTRRHWLSRLTLASGVMLLGGRALAATPSAGQRRSTPAQTEGPFYPLSRPAGQVTDLLHGANGALAEGVPLELAGQVLARDGTAMAGAVVEIWQCDARGVYRHPRAPRQDQADPAFRGFGRALTGPDAAFSFTTIVPVAYPGRPPHIHVKVFSAGREVLTTQLYLQGDPRNARDWSLSRLLSRDPQALQLRTRRATVAGHAGQAAIYTLVI